MNELAMRLGRVQALSGLARAERCRQLWIGGQIKRFPAGSTIFMEGEPCAGMFVLLSGRVHLCKVGPQGSSISSRSLNR